MKLFRYVAVTTGLAMLGALGLLWFLKALFAYLAELGDLHEHYQALDALAYVLWQAPSDVLTVLPIAALLGAVVGLGGLASTSELIVMRAAGVSLWRILAWTMVPALGAMVLGMVTQEYVAPWANLKAEQIQSVRSAVALGEVRGYWLKEGNRMVYIDYANANGELGSTQWLEFDSTEHLTQTAVAKTGTYHAPTATWNLSQIQTAQIDQQTGKATPAKQDSLPLTLELEPQFVRLVTLPPETVAPSELIRYTHYLSQQGHVPMKYRLALWNQFTAPLTVMVMVMLACSFVFGPLRQQSLGLRIVMALLVGLGFSYIHDFMGYASLVYSVSPGWFVLLPILLAATVGVVLIRRAR